MNGVDKIVIVSDHELFRIALRDALKSELRLEITAELDNVRDLIPTIKNAWPQLVLIDLTLPGISGIDTIREISRRFRSVKVLVVTEYRTEEYVIASLNGGALGYMLKDSTAAELRVAISSVLRGKRYVSSGIPSQIVARFFAGGAYSEASSPWSRVTRRERQVMKLVAEGHSTNFIAEQLGISAKTVKTHRSHLMAKLNLHNTAELTAYAIAKELVAPYVPANERAAPVQRNAAN